MGSFSIALPHDWFPSAGIIVNFANHMRLAVHPDRRQPVPAEKHMSEALLPEGGHPAVIGKRGSADFRRHSVFGTFTALGC